MLHVQLLGDFRLVHKGAPITSVRSQRQQSLLAYLAMHGGAPQPRQRLSFLFWPDSSEAQARTNLRNLLHQLRRDLPAAERLLCISTRNVEWRSEAASTLDVAAFERALRRAEEAGDDERRIQAALEEAVAYYTGDLLPALYDEWILSARERLRSLFLQALDRLIVLLESQREYARAIAYAVQLLQHDPLHEATYRRLMRLHALNHDRTAALRVYASCAELLQRELDVAPEPATVELYQQLLNEQEVSAQVTESAESPSSQPVAMTPLVGRQMAWQQIMERWQRAAGGEPHLLLISGEAGIGKTRLVEELAQWTTRQGIATAVAHCYAVEESLSYGPVVAWLRSDPLQRALPELDQIWRVELTRLLPELHLRQPSLPQPEPLTQGWQRQRLFEAVTRAVMAARQPLLLVLEDLQWCDAETLAWLHYLLRSCGPARLLVAATLRIEEIQAVHALANWQHALQRMAALGEIPLGPLNRAETAQLAALVAGQPLDAAMSAWLYQQTEGHPLFVVEMTRAGADPAHMRPPSSNSADGLEDPLPAAPLPVGMRSVIESRLNQLSPSSRDLINLAAVIGRQFTLEVLVTASGADALALADGLDEALQHRIIREQGSDSYDFSHDRIREMAYATLSQIRRRLLHHQVADALTAVYQGRIDEICGQLALHCERAGLLEKATGYYWQAADTALRLYAHQDAIHLINSGLEVLKSLPETVERDRQELALQLMLGSALAITRGYAAGEVEPVYNRARILALRLEDATQHFSALWGLRLFYGSAGRSHLAVALGWQLLDLAHAAGDEELELHARQGLGAALLHAGKFVLAHDMLEQGIALYNPHRHRPQYFDYAIDPAINCLAMLIPTLWMLGYPEQAQVRTLQLMALIDELEHPASSALALNYLSWYHWMRGDAESNLVCAERSLALCDRHGFTQLLGGALFSKGNALVGLGKIEDGISLVEQGVEMWEATGARNLMPILVFMLASACTKAGHQERALSLLEDALAEMAECGERRAESELLRLKADLLHRRGAAPAEVEAIYQQALEMARIQQGKMLELRAAVDLSRFWQAQDRCAKARQLLADVYGWFTEGFDTPDLQEARTLLKMLS